MASPKLHLVKENESQDTYQPDASVCYLIEPDPESNSEQRLISKLGGLPYWPASHPWPCCTGCGEPLTFIFQVRTDDVMRVQFGPPRMICFFYCYNCHPWWDVEGKGFLLTYLPFNANEKLLAAKHSPLDTGAVPVQQALKFIEESDYPISQELESFPEDENQRELFRQSFPNRTESKIGGFPSWLQKADIPRCPKSHQPMEFIGQLNSNRKWNVIFPDMGRVLFFRNPEADSSHSNSIVIQSE